MKLILSPQRRDDTLSVTVAGDALTLNGEVLDFSQLPDGATLPSVAIDNEWIVGDVTRENGEIEVCICLPLGPNASEEARFPEPLILTEDGIVELPV